MSSLAYFTGCSHHSLFGASTVPQIVDAFKKRNFEYVTITEQGNANSAVELYSSAKKKGLKPILGIQVLLKNQWSRVRWEKKNKKFEEVNQNGLLTIHFKDQASYQKFCQMTPSMFENAVKENGEFKPVITLEQLKSLGNITIGTAGLDGLFGILYKNQDIKTLMKVYTDVKAAFGRLYVEVSPLPMTKIWFKPMQTRGGFKTYRPGMFFENESDNYAPGGDFQRGFNDLMIMLAARNNDLVVPSFGYNFIEEKQKIAQDAKLSKDGLALIRMANSHHLRSPEEIKTMFVQMGYEEEQIETWFKNSIDWAKQFDDFKIPTSKDRWILPAFEGDSLEWAMKVVKQKGRMKWDNPVWVERLEREIKTLKFNGKIDVLPYFKPIVGLCEWCDEKGILYNLRGSAAGSLLIYLLGISGINPLDYDLSFERFINEGRIKANTLPDVDIDVGERDAVIDYLKSVYGDKIMQLSVDVMVKLKSAIRDAERFMIGHVSEETEAMCSSLPNPPPGMDDTRYIFGGTDEDGNEEEGLIDTNPMIKAYAEHNPDAWASVLQMLGILRNKGTHACSFVITDNPVTDYIPCYKVGDNLVTGFSPKSLEESGLIKYDFLGVNTLKDIGLCIKYIKERHGKYLDFNKLPDDEDVYKQFWAGNCETVFQFNTATVIPYLQKIRPTNIDHLANITALCRPGTLDAPSGDGKRTLAEVYVDRGQGEPIEYVHPDMEPILKSTYGVQLYQELQIRIFQELAGYTAEESEMVRRGIGKKDKKVLDVAITRLHEACIKRGWLPEQAQLLSDQIQAAAKYSFNKSHSVSYAKVGYACQYFKTRYPLEWWTAVLTNASKTEIPHFWEHCSAFVLLPDINKSGEGWQIEGNKIRAPLNILNGVGESAYMVIVDAKPYENITDFILKTKAHPNARNVNKGVIFKMIASGVADSLFREGMPLQDKIEEYLIAKSKYEGKKKLDSFPEEFRTFDNDVKKYRVVKELIPIWSRDLRKIVLPAMGCAEPTKDSYWIYAGKLYLDFPGLEAMCDKYKNAYDIMNSRQGEWAAKDFVKAMLKKLAPVTLAYVIEEKTKSYANKTKQMTQLLIDVSGSFQEAVLWPPFEGNIAATGFKNEIVEIQWRYSYKHKEMTIGEVRIPHIPKMS